MLAVTLAAGAARVAVLLMVEYQGQGGPNLRFSLLALDATWRYLLMLFFPRGQSIFHALPAINSVFSLQAFVALAGLGLFVAAAWRLHRVHSVITLGLVWFVLLLVPSGALLVLGRGEPLAEHRVYLSAVGIFLVWGCAFGEIWARASSHRLLAGAGLALFLASLAFQTLVRNAIWQDPVGLAQEAVRLAPTHWAPRTLMAEALRQNGRCDEAVAEYRAAIAFRPIEEFPYTMLARCLIQGGRLDEAEDALRGLLTINPASQDAAMGLGIFALLAGRLDESRVRFQEVLSRDPGRGQAALMLSFLDGSVSDADRRRVCDSLRAVTGKASVTAGCGEPGSL
jgi:tetratricopeptide (TPR) repeat protein